MDSKFLFYIDNSTPNKHMVQINKLFNKLNKYKYLKNLHNLNLIGIKKRTLLKRIRFMKEA